MKKTGKKWITVLLIIVGALIGSAIWSMLAPVLPSAFMGSIPIGTTGGPFALDMGFAKLTLGLVLNVNIGAIIGIVAAILVSLKI